MNHLIKPLAALAACATVASTAAVSRSSRRRLDEEGNDGRRCQVRPRTHILVDSKGITLYDFPPDKGTTSVCYGACAALWPPVDHERQSGCRDRRTRGLARHHQAKGRQARGHLQGATRSTTS